MPRLPQPETTLRSGAEEVPMALPLGPLCKKMPIWPLLLPWAHVPAALVHTKLPTIRLLSASFPVRRIWLAKL